MVVPLYNQYSRGNTLMAEEIFTEECAKCGEKASGPDKADVLAAMKRHAAKKHPPVWKGKK